MRSDGESSGVLYLYSGYTVLSNGEHAREKKKKKNVGVNEAIKASFRLFAYRMPD